jgi:hypothetical protein
MVNAEDKKYTLSEKVVATQNIAVLPKVSRKDDLVQHSWSTEN